jgi:Ran GTPase-activating protein 1
MQGSFKCLVFALFALKHSNIKIGGRTSKKWLASGREAEFISSGPFIPVGLNMAPTTFSLAGRRLWLDTADDVKTHAEALITSTNITHIDLSGNTLDIAACEALAPLLSSQRSLQSIDLHDIFTSRTFKVIPLALKALLDALLSCRELHTVDLSDNAFGLSVVAPSQDKSNTTERALLAFLSMHTPLKHLILNNNGMGPEAGALIAEALAELAERKSEARRQGLEVPDLESIVCGRNRLESGSMKAWAHAYKAHGSSIRSVKMTQNGIRPEGIALLLRNGLGYCNNLELLDMQDNTFTVKGAAALADVVGGWSTLKELGVGDDLLGANGAVKLFERLGRGNNKEVELLRLQFNDITTKGVEALLRAAKDGLPKLRRVELNGNKFNEDDAHIEALAELLRDRKDEFGSAHDPDDHWGVDELDELEEEESEEDDDAEEEEEREEAGERVLREAEEAEDEQVAQEEDADVDQLADRLKKTGVH